MESPYDLEDKGFVSIWVGNFGSKEEFDEYLAEKIGEDDESTTPINKFAADIGFGFYDHDFQQAEFFGARMSIQDLIAPFSHSESFLEKAVQSANKLEIKEANAAILLFDYNYKKNKTDEFTPIKFLGVFVYN